MLTVPHLSAGSWGLPESRGRGSRRVTRDGFAVTGIRDLQGRGRALHPGRVGAAERRSEGPLQGCNAGELQPPGLSG